MLAPDLTAGAAARQLGRHRRRVELTGPVTKPTRPCHANEAERRALAQIMGGRHIWLAAAPTPARGPRRAGRASGGVAFTTTARC